MKTAKKPENDAEKAPGGASSNSLSAMAKANGVYLIGGSIPESDNGKIYNTCLAFGPDGAVIGKHRKTHLFDIDLSSTGTIFSFIHSIHSLLCTCYLLL